MLEQKQQRLSGNMKKRIIDKAIKVILLIATLLSASIIFLIIYQIAERGLRPLFVSYTIDGQDVKIGMWQFLTGLRYGGKFYYGIGYIIINTIYTASLAILVATPIAILTATFIVKMAPKKVGVVLNSIVEMLAAVPSIIYGMFGAGFIASIVRSTTPVTGNLSLLTTVIVLAMMILPTITMMATTAIKSIPSNIEEGSLALGASPTQTIFKVTIPAAKSGIFTGVILAVGRALGEATAVSLVSGQAGSGPSFSFFDTTHTLSSAILVGLKEITPGSLDYEIRFTMGLVLIAVILFFNILLNYLKKRMGSYEL